MRNARNDYSFDDSFEYQGETIFYRIIHDNKPIRKRDGVEKMSGFFAFTNSKGDNLGTIAFYENYEDMTPVHYSILEKYYTKLISK